MKSPTNFRNVESNGNILSPPAIFHRPESCAKNRAARLDSTYMNFICCRPLRVDVSSLQLQDVWVPESRRDQDCGR